MTVYYKYAQIMPGAYFSLDGYPIFKFNCVFCIFIQQTWQSSIKDVNTLNYSHNDQGSPDSEGRDDEVYEWMEHFTKTFC